MSAYKSKRKKEFPCLRCNEHVKVIKCLMCELWVHKECEKMDDTTFSVLDMQHEETGQCFWSCRSCKTYALKFDRRMRALEKRVDDLEQENKILKVGITSTESEIDA